MNINHLWQGINWYDALHGFIIYPDLDKNTQLSALAMNVDISCTSWGAELSSVDQESHLYKCSSIYAPFLYNKELVGAIPSS